MSNARTSHQAWSIPSLPMYDAIVIGGGFYGGIIAEHLKTARGFGRVALAEREDQLMTRSSFANQARVHGGYHYPRSFTTAYRSRVNMARFVAEFGPAIFDDFTSLYAIARRNSKVTPAQMERLCREIGAPLEPAPAELESLFNLRLIERVYLTVEQAFNADVLRSIMEKRLAEADVEMLLTTEIEEVTFMEGALSVRGLRHGQRWESRSSYVFNCTYSRLQQTVRHTNPPDFSLRHEIAELVLVEPPEQLRSLGVTVMDGPFFSVIPFPARNLHSFTHVRYTPHQNWLEDADKDPYCRLSEYERGSGVEWMVRDASRYLPCLSECRPVSTLFEVKTVLLKSEGNDSRPILMERHGIGGRIFSVLGGKIDNVYDALAKLDLEQFDHVGEQA